MAGDNVQPSTDSGVRLADLVGAFSLATDLGLGQPMDHVLRSWRIAAALGEHLGVEPDGRAALYYVVTLAWVGCVADTPEVADINAEADRLVALGATRVSEGPCSEHGSTWLLMSDPEGNEFCVCDGGQGSATT